MAKSKSKPATALIEPEPSIISVALSRLHFDPQNARFGDLQSGSSDTEILDRIVAIFGVEDVISSLAENGYMPTEPLVGIRESGDSIRILEGNRRLAALLILADDPRAKNQQRWRDSTPLADGAKIDPVPVVVYDEKTQPSKLLPYLGARHILGSKAWDSYAKAAWVARMLDDPSLEIQDMERMTGDSRGTIARLLGGYYLMRQLADDGRYDPKESYHKGRGSSSQLPFSWVYNALGYKSVQKWVGMEGGEIGPDPVPTEKLPQAVELFEFLFGRKSTAKQAAIPESRLLSELAECLDDPNKVSQLRNGKPAADVVWASREPLSRTLEALNSAISALEEAQSALAELSVGQIETAERPAKHARKLSANIVKLIDRMADGGTEDD